MKRLLAILAAALLGLSLPIFAADYPVPKEADWVARDFRFHTGEVAAALRIHYTTVGKPGGEPVLVLSRGWLGHVFFPPSSAEGWNRRIFAKDTKPDSRRKE